MGGRAARCVGGGHVGRALGGHTAPEGLPLPTPPCMGAAWVRLPAGWFAGLLAGWFAGWLRGCVAAWLRGWLRDWLARHGWLAGWLAGWLGGWVAGKAWLAQSSCFEHQGAGALQIKAVHTPSGKL